MAAKKKAKAARKSSSATASTPTDALIDAALAEAADTGWRNVTLRGIAERAGTPLSEVLALVPTRAHVVARFFDRLDAHTLAGVKSVDESDSARDRLFDVTMRRYDALNAERDGARALIKGLPLDPAGMAAALCRVDRSLSKMLAAAGISADGLPGLMRLQGYKLVHLAALRAWMKDDTDDLAKTMAAVDKALSRAERVASGSILRRWRRGGAEAAEA